MLQPARQLYFHRRVDYVAIARPLWNAWTPTAASMRGKSEAKKRGLRYEERIFDYLYEAAPNFISHLPFQFTSEAKIQKAIPDGLIFDFAQNTIIVVEVKYRHTADAWHQLNNFYMPIVRAAYPSAQVFGLEICKNYDPRVKLPGLFTVGQKLEALVKSPAPFAVLIRGA